MAYGRPEHLWHLSKAADALGTVARVDQEGNIPPVKGSVVSGQEVLIDVHEGDDEILWRVGVHGGSEPQSAVLTYPIVRPVDGGGLVVTGIEGNRFTLSPRSPVTIEPAPTRNGSDQK